MALRAFWLDDRKRLFCSLPVQFEGLCGELKLYRISAALSRMAMEIKAIIPFLPKSDPSKEMCYFHLFQRKRRKRKTYVNAGYP